MAMAKYLTLSSPLFPPLQNEEAGEAVFMKVPATVDTAEEPRRCGWGEGSSKNAWDSDQLVHSASLPLTSCGITQASSSLALIYPSVQGG